MARQSCAFTLIELLVVITIIVVLLALLTPALDKAIYQAELAVCGARLKVVGGQAVVYAMESRRAYPHRVGARSPDWSEPNLLRNANPFSFGSNWDERPVLRSVFDLNTLNCPLVGPVDLDHEELDTVLVLAPYALRFDFAFANRSRMARLGNRWSSVSMDGLVTTRFSILAHDFSTSANDGEVVASWGTHPDRDGVLVNTIRQDEIIGTTQPLKVTASRWDGPLERGPVDLNYAFEDGSVGRVHDIAYEQGDDTRIVAVPEYDAGWEAKDWQNWMPKP